MEVFPPKYTVSLSYCADSPIEPLVVMNENPLVFPKDTVPEVNSDPPPDIATPPPAAAVVIHAGKARVIPALLAEPVIKEPAVDVVDIEPTDTNLVLLAVRTKLEEPEVLKALLVIFVQLVE